VSTLVSQFDCNDIVVSFAPQIMRHGNLPSIEILRIQVNNAVVMRPPAVIARFQFSVDSRCWSGSRCCKFPQCLLCEEERTRRISIVSQSALRMIELRSQAV
jgi:hypothetical protein